MEIFEFWFVKEWFECVFVNVVVGMLIEYLCGGSCGCVSGGGRFSDSSGFCDCLFFCSNFFVSGSNRGVEIVVGVVMLRSLVSVRV